MLIHVIFCINSHTQAVKAGLPSVATRHSVQYHTNSYKSELIHLNSYEFCLILDNSNEFMLYFVIIHTHRM
jgi:hypothetical protein